MPKVENRMCMVQSELKNFTSTPPPKKKTTHAAMGPEGYHAYLKKNFSWVTLTDQYSTEVSRFSRDSSDFNSGKI